MLRVNQNIQEQIKEASSILEDAASDTALHEALAARGLSLDLIESGRALLDRLRSQFEEQLDSYSAKFAATERANEKLQQLIREYTIHVDMARAVFREDPEALDQLDLLGQRKSRQADRLTEAKLFYETLREEQVLADAMAESGLPPALSEEMLGRVDEALAARTAQQVLTNVSRQNTSIRNEIAVELRAFMRAFRGYLRMAAVEDPSIRSRYNV